jgi:hypothetical protein
VWNHPHISRTEMHYLQNYLIKLLVRYSDFIHKGISRLIWGGLCQDGIDLLWRHLIKGPVASMFINDRKQVVL